MTGFYFTATEGYSTWTVPDDVTVARFALWGGGMQGATSGGEISDLTPGEVLHFNVGGSPVGGGWNGGGASVGAFAGGFFDTGGGGATDVRRGSNDTSDRIFVAGGIGGRSLVMLPAPGFINTFGPSGGPTWVYFYKTLEGYSYYTSPGDPDGWFGPETVSVATHGPAAGSGSNGADSVTESEDVWSYLPNPEDDASGGSRTFHLGAGGGGYLGGHGGLRYSRQADPLRYSDRYQANNWGYDGVRGSDYVDPTYGAGPGLVFGTWDWLFRPDGWPDLYYAQRSKPGAIFVSWEEDVAGFQGWSTGSVRVGPEEGW